MTVVYAYLNGERVQVIEVRWFPALHEETALIRRANGNMTWVEADKLSFTPPEPMPNLKGYYALTGKCKRRPLPAGYFTRDYGVPRRELRPEDPIAIKLREYTR